MAKGKGKEKSFSGDTRNDASKAAKGKGKGKGKSPAKGAIDDEEWTGKGKGKAAQGSRDDKSKGKGKSPSAGGSGDNASVSAKHGLAVVRHIVHGKKPGFMVRLGNEELYKPAFLFENWLLQPRVGDHISFPSTSSPRLAQAAEMTAEDMVSFLENFDDLYEKSPGSTCSDLVTYCYPHMLRTFECGEIQDSYVVPKMLLLTLAKLAGADITASVDSPEWIILLDAVRSPFARLRLPALISKRMVEVEKCISFCDRIVLLAPDTLCFLKPLLHATIVVQANRKDAETAIWRLWHIVEAASDGIAKASGYHEAVSWKFLPVVPLPLSSDLTDITELPVARTKFNSADQYLDTMFRLLRANCFLKLKQGIQDFISGTLDTRDMMVYASDIKGVALLGRSAGFVITSQCRALRGNLGPRSLLFGNLVCLSLGSKPFEVVAWGKVVERPSPKKRVKVMDVTLQFPDEINKSQGFPLLMQVLQSAGQTLIMAESPVYFQAYSSVFKVLQGLRPEALPLASLILGQGQGKSSRVAWADDAIRYFDANIQPTIDPDPHQRRAIEAMLQQPLSTIQGPPGTGKTFVGLKAVQALVSVSTVVEGSQCFDEFHTQTQPMQSQATSFGRGEWDSDSSGGWEPDCREISTDSDVDSSFLRRQPPLLVLCYKNHALDEFLSSSLSFTKEIVRIGSRGDESLKGYNLRELARAKDKGKSVNRQLHQNIKMKEEIAQKVKKQMELICEATQPVRVFFQRASDDQLLSLVCGCQGKHHQAHARVKQALQHGGQRDDLCVEDISKCYKQWMDHKPFTRHSLNAGDHLMDEKSTGDDGADDADEEQEERKGHEEAVDKLPLPMPAWHELAGPPLSRELDVLFCADVWSLVPADKAALVRSWVADEMTRLKAKLEQHIQEYNRLLGALESLERNHKVDILRSAKIVGATITGASIHVQLLRDVGFQIAVIEEAGEILEPLTIAAIPPSVKQLILIGDHYQLRPLLESDELSANKLDISMMERLIHANQGNPSAQLNTQNRMREEMVKLIRDIYPSLSTNYDRVRKHLPISCFEDGVAMFFKDTSEHLSESSGGGRSLCNPGEASEIVELVSFLIFEGIHEHVITVLSMYKGQRWLLSKQLCEKGFSKVVVETVDRYQGDENDVVLVSLVRSDKSTRFVDMKNRRCVAASRAHRCVVFFGAANMLRKQATAWRHVINTLSDEGLLGKTLPLECPRHPGIRLCLGHRCHHTCASFLDCGHKCGKPCHRLGAHPPCEVIVKDVFLRCGHDIERPCSKPLEQLQCKSRVEFTHDECGHRGSKLCYQSIPKCKSQISVTCELCGQAGYAECAYHREKPDAYKCQHMCTRKMSCGHPCTLKCGIPCDNGIDDCSVCEAERKLETDKRKAEIEESIENLIRDDRIDYSNVEGSKLIDVQQSVSAFFASSGSVAEVERVTRVVNAKSERRYLIASQRCNTLVETRPGFVVVSSEAEAFKAVEEGLDKAGHKFQKHVDFHTSAPSKIPAECLLVLCDFQPGRVYEHGIRNHSAPFSKKPPDNFDSSFDNQSKCYRLWTTSRALPKYLVYATVKSSGIPSHWSGITPTQGWSVVPERDSGILRILQECLVTDGSELGHGRDVVEHGRYNKLSLELAWRIEHPGLWQRYSTERDQIAAEIKARKLHIPKVAVRRELLKATTKLADKLNEGINEVRLLHGTKPETLLAILSNGLNERFSGGLFGDGSYLAEDAGKNDQYATRDSHYGQVRDLHERLYREGVTHPNTPVYYIFVCKVVLGYFVTTKDGKTDARARGRPVFAGTGRRELMTIPDLTPPINYHALLAELGGTIHRHREFVQYHSARIYPEYLIAYRRTWA